MTLDQIQNHNIRSLITGSCTPASDVLDRREQFTEADMLEANTYFLGRHPGGLAACAVAEKSALTERDA